MSTDASRYTRPSLLMRLRSAEDAAAWSEFVRLYGPVIVGWCQHRGLQASDADDVAQDVLLRLAARMRTFQYDPSQGSFRAYLCTLSKYAVNDFYSRWKERGSGDSSAMAAMQTVAAREDLAARLDRTFDHELLAEGLRRVRNRVEESTWAAFDLTALQDLPAAQAAAQLSMSVAGVYQSKSRVLRLLREELSLLDPVQDSCDRVQSILSSP